MTNAWLSGLLVCAGLAAASWLPAGPEGGPLQAFAIDPANHARLFALASEDSNNPRLFRSTDAGESWTFAGRLSDSCVTSLAVDPARLQVLYGCGRQTRINRSTDAGATWARIELPGYATMVRPDPLVPGRVFASGYGLSGALRPLLFVSEDTGTTWDDVTVDTFAGHAMCCAVDPTAAGVVYVAGTYGRLYRTTDAGATWELRNSGLPPTSTVQSVSLRRGSSNVVLAATTAGLYRSSDAGLTWSLVAPEALQWKAEFSPADEAIGYAIGYDFFASFYVSTDTGLTWQQAVPGTEVDRTDGLRPDPDSGARVYLHTIGGVKRSDDEGSEWRALNSGMRIANVTALSVTRHEPERVYVAAAGNALFASGDAAVSWQRLGSFAACGHITGIGVAPGPVADRLYALEGSG